MKKDLHPDYVDCVVTCACGHSFAVQSTKDQLKVDLCHKCHPFFTGEEKLLDSAGRIDKFNKKYNIS